MATDLPPRGEAGFTLIEVLVAMVVLSVGLLGLEALGITAARSVSAARLQSQYTSVATRVMEGAQQSVHTAPGSITGNESCTTDAPSGFHVCTRIQSHATTAAVNPQSAKVTVRVARTSAGPFYTISSYVFDSALP